FTRIDSLIASGSPNGVQPLEYNAMQAGLSLAPLSLSMFAVALLAAKKSGDRRPSKIIRWGFVLLTIGIAALIPIVPQAEFGWGLIIPLLIAGSGLGLLVSQLNNYTLAPIEEQRISEAAGVNSAAGSFGLSFGLAFAGAIMLAALLIDPVTIHHRFHARPRPDSPFRFRPSPPTPAFSLWRNQIELPPFTG
ncbi:MFS transporter, partial [Rhodococcus qingshengii]|uniref:MFS transporter n=1 Tax=Rhodococcus qingshengii TaxID=334542 RepID=UPI0022B2F392